MWSAANIMNGCESNLGCPRSHLLFWSGGLTCLPVQIGRLHREMLRMSTIMMRSNVKE